MVSITREQFRVVYAGTNLIEQEEMFFSEPKSDEDLVSNYLTSKLWRLNNLYTIVDRHGKKNIFSMNMAQHIVYAASLKHSRLIILKSRQQGISTLWLICFFDDALVMPDFTIGLMAQGTDEAERLLLRTKLLWDELHPAVKQFLAISIVKNNTKELSFNNGSSIFIRTSFRSATLQRLHISEFGKIANKYPERARETLTGTLQAIAKGNIVAIESTAEGDNIFKHMWDNSISYAGELADIDFKPVFLSWLDDPECTMEREQELDIKAVEYFYSLEKSTNVTISKGQKNFWIAKKRELGEDIYQEYPATPQEAFLKNRKGTYFAALYLRLVRNKGREIPNLFDPNLDVQVAMDLGRNDLFVMVFFQTFTDGWRIINCYHNSGFGIKHYCDILDTMSEELSYTISNLILPHDAAVTDLSEEGDATREEVFWRHGYTNTYIVDRTKDINNDRELVREAIPIMYVDPQAQYIIDCFLNYSKEWDAKRQIWKEVHAHNEFSHGMDAIRQMVRGGKTYTRRRRKVYNNKGDMDI